MNKCSGQEHISLYAGQLDLDHTRSADRCGSTDRHAGHDKIVNQTELRVIGMSRSGNHAVIHWILSQAQGRTCFLNCAEGKTNPFLTARPLHSNLVYEANYLQFDWQQEGQGLFSHKDLLIHSYEDNFLGNVAHPIFEQNHDQWVGASSRRYDLLILRDPFNLFASRRRAKLAQVSTRTAVRVWQQHAREFLGQRRYLNQPLIAVNYNRWATERPYRRQLAAQLGLHFTDAGIQLVQPTGGGSSFDGARYNGAAEQMRVLDRWQFYRDDPSFWQSFDPVTVDLAQRIFGSFPEFEPRLRWTTGAAPSGDLASRR